MTSAEQEKAWNAEFENIGEAALRDGVFRGGGVGVGITDEPKRQHAFRWLRDRERAREWRETWTFRVVVAGLILGVVGILVTLWH
jgi:hypothetical protein